MVEQEPNNSTSMAQLMRQTRLDYEGINNNLLQNIQKLDNENVIIFDFYILYRDNLKMLY